MTATTTVNPKPCHLGIDVGTQGLTALLVESTRSKETQKSSLQVVAMGEGSYGFVPHLPEGCYEQDPIQWEKALLEALVSIRQSLQKESVTVRIDALCVTGQMHGCVMLDKDGNHLGTARLWCDARNQEEVNTASLCGINWIHHSCVL